MDRVSNGAKINSLLPLTRLWDQSGLLASHRSDGPLYYWRTLKSAPGEHAWSGTPGKFMTRAETRMFSLTLVMGQLYSTPQLFLQHYVSPCLKGKYKLFVMPQCSSRSFLHQGHVGVRAYSDEESHIRADHAHYSSITFNRKRYVTLCRCLFRTLPERDMKAGSNRRGIAPNRISPLFLSLFFLFLIKGFLADHFISRVCILSSLLSLSCDKCETWDIYYTYRT